MFGVSASAMIIIAIAIAVPSIGWLYDSNELKVCKAEYSSFQSNTQLEGERSNRTRVETETGLAQAAVNIQGDLNAKQTELDRVYADYERLRRANKGGSSGSKTDPLSDSAAGFNCPDNGAKLAGALEQLESGVLPILRTRDEAINRTIACKKYIDDIEVIINGGSNVLPDHPE